MAVLFFLEEIPYASYQIEMLRRTLTDNVELKHESILTISEKIQFAQLMITATSAQKLGRREVSAGAASMTCMDECQRDTCEQ
jgi:hypothetical protein